MLQAKLSSSKWFAVVALAAILALGAAACGSDDDSSTGTGTGTESESGGGGLSGSIRIGGSSTVAPLTEAVAERFMAKNPDLRITVGGSGTDGGFKELCAGEIDINDASRAIEPEEVKACKRGGVGYKAVHVATDALTIIANSELFVFCLNVDQLAAIWGPGSKIDNWSEVPGPIEKIDRKMVLFGPGPGSGSFDYFTKAINGEAGAIRKDYNDVGEDDGAIVEGVESSLGGLGYVSFSTYTENADKLRVVDVDNGPGCVWPTVETAQEGRYAPLTRPLFIYPSDEALRRPEVRAFVKFYLANVNAVAESVDFVPLTDRQLAKSKRAAKKAGL